MLRGGKSEGKKPDDFDKKELAMGVKVEMEHTNNKKLAEKIAMDHLTEDGLYYSKLKHAGLADELREENLMGLTSPLALFPDKDNSKGIQEPDTTKVDKQTVQGTVFPPVKNDPAKGPDMAGCIGSTHSGGAGVENKTNVEAPSKDPTPTDHITGAIGNSPSSPNVLSKGQANIGLGGGSQMMTIAQQALGRQPVGQDIEIDIAEGKRLLKKMLTESIKGSATAFGPRREGVMPSGGDPMTDTNYVKGKRWTVDYGRKTTPMKEMDTAVGDYHNEQALQAVRTIINQSNGDREQDLGSIMAYLEDQGIRVDDTQIEQMYDQETSRKASGM